MSSAPVNLKGLEDLLERRYSLSVVSGHLVVNDVWYLDSAGELLKGRLAAPLTLVDAETVGTPPNHQMFWSGSAPHYKNGEAIPLAAQSVSHELGKVVYTSHLSNKPPEGFSDYTGMVEHYVSLISAPAESMYGVNARTGAIYEVPEENSPFKVLDTFSARAQILELNQLLANDRVALIGLGGTGSFLLDFLIKTPVYSIDAYDFDVFEVHNGFRSPGEVPFELFGRSKTTVYEHKYASFRHRIRFQRLRIDKDHKELFADCTFAFVCIDDGESRAEICAMLRGLNIPFIDVGMGVEKEAGHLDGLLRTTLITEQTADRAFAELPVDSPGVNGAYRTYVQIAELNALNAALAIIRYKQFRGFYSDDAEYCNVLYSISMSKIAGLS